MRSRNREDFVREFNKAFGHPTGGEVTQEGLTLRHKLIYEEYDELRTEIAAAMVDLELYGQVSIKTKARLLKELADLQYVISGLAVVMNFPLQEAFVRVHKSNMSKLGVNGKPVLREDGKVLKGPNYSPPDMESYFDEEV